ncbi:MAG: ATP-binding protein [Myxococcota bacterium]
MNGAWLHPKLNPTLRALINATSDAIIVTDLKFTILRFNRAAERLYGWRKDDVEGRMIGEVVPTTYLDAAPGDVLESFWKEGAWSGEVIQRTQSGQGRFIASSVNLVRDDDGTAVGVIAINRDITEARRAQAARGLIHQLARSMVTAPVGRTRGRAIEVLCAALGSRSGLLAVVDHAGDLLCSTNERKTFVWPRVSWSRVLPDQTSIIELRQAPHLPLPGVVAALGSVLVGPIGGGHGRLGYLILQRPADSPDSSEGHLLELLNEAADQLAPILRAQRQRDQQRQERAVLADRVRQGQRLEAVGRLAGGIAHDFSNLLTIIANHADLGLRQEAAGKTQMHLEAISRAADRAMALTSQLVAFGRKAPGTLGCLDLAAALRELEPLIQRLIGEDILVDASILEESVWIHGQRSPMDQIMLNLVVNARDAMEEGGRLTMILDRQPAPAHAGLARAVRLAVRDTGIGMAPEVTERVFEPFFTTKGPARGSGLGLFTVYGIVQQHQGHIEVVSTPGEGTVFSVWFPEVDAPPQEELPKTRARPHPAAGRRVLLVEDEADLREVLAQALGEAGYRVMVASGRTEALSYVGESFDLVLTDVVMPDGSGAEVVGAFQARQPEVRTLFMSGHAGDAIERYGLDPAIPRIDKPFRVDDVIEMVEWILGNPP